MYRKIAISTCGLFILLSVFLLSKGGASASATSRNWNITTPVIHQINNYISYNSPALLKYNGALYVAYVGTDHNLYITSSTDGGVTFADDVQITNAGQNTSAPGLTSYKGHLYVAWISTNVTGAQVNIGYYDTYTNSSQLKNYTTIAAPNACSRTSLSSLERVLYVAWKDCDAGKPYGHTIEIAASSDGQNFTRNAMIPPSGGLDSGPSLLAFHDTLYVAWRDMYNGQYFYIATYPGTGQTLQNATRLNIGGLGTLAMTAFHNQIWVSWDETASQYNVAYYNGTDQLQNQQSTGIDNGTGPGFTAYEGHLYIAWAAIRTDTNRGQLFIARL